MRVQAKDLKVGMKLADENGILMNIIEIVSCGPKTTTVRLAYCMSGVETKRKRFKNTDMISTYY